MGLSNIKNLLMFTGLFLLLSTLAHGRTIYVDDDANAPGDGSSWVTAYKYLQDALADANDAAKPVEIRVAQGTYKPDGGTRVKAGDYKATFRLVSGVALKGGFAGIGAPGPNVRDVAMHETILSGDIHDDDPDVNDPGDLLLSFVGPNSHTIITGSGTDGTAVLDGFTITAAHHYLHPVSGRIRPGAPPRPLEGWGGGMNNAAGSPTVIGCTFIGNMSTFSGAAMCNVEGSHPTVTDCVFVGNYAVGGGALANWNGSNPTVTGCTFCDNVAGREGGAVRNRRSSPTFTDCTFFRNAVEPRSYGGAIYNEESTCRFADCRFERNAALAGGAICNYESVTLILEACVFAGNSADQGGAIVDRAQDSSLTAVACIFKQNAASGSGGAMDLWGPAEVSNCIFSGNACRVWGGAVHLRGGTFTNCLFAGNRAFDRRPGPTGGGFPGMGGAVSHLGSIEALHFTNCTFDENRASYGSAVYTDWRPSFHNCILRGPASLIWSDPYEPPQVAYCDVEGGRPGAGNIDVDPVFAAPGYWADPNDPNGPGDPNDPDTVWMDGDYHLKSQTGRWDPVTESWVVDEVTSPCIDAGDPNTPIGYEPFPNGGRINLGAYGGTAEASKSYFGEPVCEAIIAGDLNGDCKVDWRDLEILSRHWLGDTTAK